MGSIVVSVFVVGGLVGGCGEMCFSSVSHPRWLVRNGKMYSFPFVHPWAMGAWGGMGWVRTRESGWVRVGRWEDTFFLIFLPRAVGGGNRRRGGCICSYLPGERREGGQIILSHLTTFGVGWVGRDRKRAV